MIIGGYYMTIKDLKYDGNFKLTVFELGGIVSEEDYQYIEKTDITNLEITGNEINVYLYDKNYKFR